MTIIKGEVLKKMSNHIYAFLTSDIVDSAEPPSFKKVHQIGKTMV